MFDKKVIEGTFIKTPFTINDDWKSFVQRDGYNIMCGFIDLEGKIFITHTFDNRTGK